MARYNIPSDKAFGVSIGTLQKRAKHLGKNHELALGLWETGWYEARLLAAFLDEPARVSAAQMERWCREFDSWAIVDTACFALLDRTPHAWGKVRQWAGRRGEFQKRAAFALLASLVAQGLRLIEKGAMDERNFVKKGVNWALRCVGKRNVALNAAAVTVAKRLAGSTNPAGRWVGKDALRELTSPVLIRKLKSRSSKKQENP
jgi:3-methyladenine DNA glycosylase AlkD